jgi:hypothetical protein
MSNDILNAISLHGLPTSWPAGKRLLFFWYAHRQNDERNKAWPGMEELERITGYTKGTLLTYRRELRIEGYLEHITFGHRGQRSEFRVHFPPIIRVLPSAPSEDKTGYPPEAKRVVLNELLGAPQNINGCAGEYAKKKKEIEKKKRKTQDLARFEFILQALPAPLRAQVKLHKTLNELLDNLERKGTSLDAIRGHLSAFDWNGIEKPGGIVVTRLRELLATKSANEVPLELPWCGICDEETRKVDRPWEYEGSNGATTRDCPRCSKFGSTHRPIRGTNFSVPRAISMKLSFRLREAPEQIQINGK